MSDDKYTPTTDDVLHAYLRDEAEARKGSDGDSFRRFLVAIRAEQREIDALIAESEIVRTGFSLKADIAAAIRAAGEQPGTETKTVDPEALADALTIHRRRTSTGSKRRFYLEMAEDVIAALNSLPSDPEQKAGK